MFLADSGASGHMFMSDQGMINVKKIATNVMIGNGKKILCEKMGDVRSDYTQNGKKQKILLKDVIYVPGLYVNLFSIGRAIKQGWAIGNEGKMIFIQKGRNKLVFDRILDTGTGFLSSVELIPVGQKMEVNDHHGAGEEPKVTSPEVGKGLEKATMSLKTLHSMLGHAHHGLCWRTAHYYGWKVTDKDMAVCEPCGLAKAKQAKLNKEDNNKAKVVGERLCLDIQPMMNASYGGAKNWLLVVDELSGYCWSYFLKSKDETVNVVVPLLKDLRERLNLKIRFIRCDNSGENKSLRDRCFREGLGIKFIDFG